MSDAIAAEIMAIDPEPLQRRNRPHQEFLPIEDQSYGLVTAQLPDGASLLRTACWLVSN